MATNIKNGKLPLSQKRNQVSINAEDIFDNALAVDPALVDLLKEKGYVCRYINAKRYSDMGGSHPSRWKPVPVSKLKEWGYATISVSPDFGSDADGYIRRAELVLAIRSIDLNEKHKAYLAQEADRARVKNLMDKQRREAKSTYSSIGQFHSGYQHDYQDEGSDGDEE